jgi:hypothetical protein
MRWAHTLEQVLAGRSPLTANIEVLIVQRFRFVLVAVISAATIVVSAAPAASEARPARAVEAGSGAVVARDISFPQCEGSQPRTAGAVSGVLGANNGASFSRNPCLVAELRWAKRLAAAPAFYANTGAPEPGRSKHWPVGQVTPRVCSSSNPGSTGCFYDYGWNAGRQSFATATDAAQRLHRVTRADAHQRVANVDWWLDVETMNSWRAIDGPATRRAYQRDVATLTGEMAALRDAGVARVGIYSTPFQWKLITGGSKITGARFAHTPQWLAGYESHASAAAACAQPGFTGGPVQMTQYLGHDGFDADVVCTEADAD